MPMSLRAKQFLPFAAVVGLEDALRRVEEKVDNQKDFERLTEEELFYLDEVKPEE